MLYNLTSPLDLFILKVIKKAVVVVVDFLLLLFFC